MIAERVRQEERVLITLDLDFANEQSYPPLEHSGIVVLRMKRQDKPAILALMPRIIACLATRQPAGELWIVQPDRVRFRVKS